jgi:hypothetical protein
MFRKFPGLLLLVLLFVPASIIIRSEDPSSAENIQVPPPPFSDGIFPCSECHKDLQVNTVPRELTMMHDDIKLKHGPKTRWCLDCHNPADRDKLRLASGETIPFEKSYLLCGQCHGDKLRDWRAGAHGKRTGNWNGQKQYFLCAHCHNPHSPHFKPLPPMPPQVAPDQVRLKKGGAK